CAAALKAQYKADRTGRPDACRNVKDDDYNVLVASAAMADLGWLDDDGDLDEDKMIGSVTKTP
ncbi:hypothetical protein, partial [Micromonospora sp. NPDC002575]|uniref:hypothetical protein n=1 Tax=Micromonospora sp. NPDC002575 TaxID=3364222 RepID=UPI0036A009CE